MKTVVLIHGIRTRAWWQGSVAAILADEAGCNVVPLKYGYFDLLRFLFPGPLLKRGPIERIHRELRTAIARHPKDELYVIAHSFGTFALANVLLKFDDIRLNGLILCGSIVPATYPWSRIAAQFRTQPARGHAINECGTRDMWPPLAESVTWGYSATGTYGFGAVDIQDRVHRMPHSGYFDDAFVREFWVPFITDGTVNRPNTRGEGAPCYFWLFNLPLRWLVAASLVGPVTLGVADQVIRFAERPAMAVGEFECMADSIPLRSCSVDEIGRILVISFEGSEAAAGVLVDRYKGAIVADGSVLVVSLSNEFNASPNSGTKSQQGPSSELRLSSDGESFKGQWKFEQRMYRFSMSKKAIK